ncbi:MAG TPA: 1-acyl-sn-glycerol-3-phosphate acyltransferase [Trueperaceae bacterium]|nr:1-acyl-sn-glycerol-3-phosphate acyltransferase [Trueperaceae bacterium]
MYLHGTIIYKMANFLVWVYAKLFYGIKVSGTQNIPKEGAIVFVSNHISAVDPPFLGMASPRVLNMMAKKELFEKQPLRWLVRQLLAFPVDREGNAMSAIKEALRRLKMGAAVLVFIQGTRKEDVSEAMNGASFLAQRAKAVIIPIGIWQIGRRYFVNFGEPITPKGKSKEEMAALTDSMLININSLLPKEKQSIRLEP